MIRAFLLVSIVHVTGHLMGWESMQLVTKPLLIPLLFLSFYKESNAVLSAALLFSWVGDLALMPDGERWFMAGIGSFLLAQVCYSIIFIKDIFGKKFNFLQGGGSFVLIVLFILVVGSLILPSTGNLFAPVAIYMVVISFMLWLALIRIKRNRPDTALVAIGAVLFVISDSLIAINTFYRHIPLSGVWVMSTYLAAQYLLVRGLTRASTSS